MTFTPHTSIVRRFAVLVGVGAGALLSLPAIAQQAPESQMQQPMNNPIQEPATQEPAIQQPATQEPAIQQPATQASPTSQNIVQTASGNPSFSTLTRAIQAAGLTETLSEGSYTVFAPTNEAFAELPDGALEFLLKPENRDLLRQVLTYHVVPSKVTSSQIRTGVVEAIGGGLAVRVTPDNRVIVNNGSVIQPDIQTSNGVIHAVNRVLLPETLKRQLASRLGV